MKVPRLMFKDVLTEEKFFVEEAKNLFKNDKIFAEFSRRHVDALKSR